MAFAAVALLPLPACPAPHPALPVCDVMLLCPFVFGENLAANSADSQKSKWGGAAIHLTVTTNGSWALAFQS